ncbi:hypothetical protein KFE25_006277 [Diacronema lutheri]|uniref:Uncharacterized protein n=1 Tax=Diacronema lutheri TaxID=2081491 RepID=A0A8J6CCE9_DIALT|nr:hypothetical protein KFE25_006277 [Diacronema lutheri]
MVEGPHRLYLRARHTLDVAHVLKVLRDSYHEAIILAFEAASAERARAPARAAGAGGAGVVGALFGRLWPAASTAGGGGEDGTRVGNASHGLPPANRSVDPTRAERRLRDAGLARFVARAFGGGGAQPTSTLQAAAGGSEAGTEARTMTESIESWAGGSTGPREARFLCAEEATELALVRAHSDGAVAADADADADAYADADAAAPTRDESYDALDEDKAEGERAALSTARACTREASLVDLFDAALAQAAARQWRLSVPLLAAACALLAGSAYAQLAVQIKPGWESASESTALLRADAFAVAYLAAAIALMLALQPTRSFLPLVRVAAQALALLYGSALLVSTRTFALRFVNARGAQAELVAEAGADVRAHAALLAAAVGWEPLLVLPMLAGSFANITQALWRHGKDVGSLSYCLFLTVGVASCGEVCGVVAKRLLLGWLTGGRGATVVLATVVRTAVKGSLSSLLLWPRFRSVAHGLLAGALTSIGVSTQPQAPLAPLLGFGSAAVPQPSDLLADARAALRPLRAGDGGAARGEVDEEGLCAVLGGAAGAFDEPPAGHHAPDGPDGADAQPLHFVVHSAGDAARDKAAALARWARDLERPPRLVIDRVPTGQSCASLDDKERQLALATASLGLCSRLVVVAGPAFADSLWAVALLHAWTCLGRSADDATLVLAVPAPNAAARAAGADAAAAAAAGRAVLESFDAFAVMYARADAEGAESAAASSCAQLTLAVELATASAYNECVRAFVPLVHAQLCLLERAADGTAEAAHERAAPPVEPAVLALGALSEAHAEARLAAFAAPPALRRSGSGSSGSSGSAADAEPTFISHLRLAGAAQALVAAFGLRHAVPTSGPFVPLPLKGGAVARAAAVRRELCRRLSSRSSEESPARESPAREPMQTTPAAMLAPLAPRRRFEEDWAQQPLLSRTLASQ